MSKRRKALSGSEVISVLVKKFGFLVHSQRGSHVKLRGGRGHKVTIVPLHKELAPGTLRGLLALAGIEKHDFLTAVSKKR